MSKVLSFNNFQTSYKKLIQQAENDLTKINIEFYHHDFQSEPLLHIESDVENVIFEDVEGHGKVISILTTEATFSFSERNYHTNLSNDAVVFSSKHDDETHCIIDFI